MRATTLIPCALAAFVLVAVPAWPRQEQQTAQNGKQTAAKAQNQATTQEQTATAQPDPLAEAARKAREAQKNAPKAAKVFTNDNIPTAGGVSFVGTVNQPPASSGAAAKGAKTANATPANNEQTWRERFASLRHKLQQDQAELDVMQRELGVLNVQYYSDPNKQMEQQLSREDINKKTAAIEEKKKQVAADQQAISDAEDALRRAGGDPGWANP